MESHQLSWKEYGDWVFYACAVVSVIFVLTYLVLAPWWRTSTGRNIMFVMGTLALAMVYFGIVIHSGGISAGFYPVRASLFSMMFIGITWRVVLLFRAQLGARRSLEKGREDYVADER